MDKIIWNEIKNDEDILKLHKTFSFHDSCIKELRYDSGQWVNKDLSMTPFNSRNNVYVFFQTQWEKCPVIEMLFEEVVWLNLRPEDGGIQGDIWGSYMCFEEGLFVWINNNEIIDNYKELYEKNYTSWIKSKRVKWRVANEYLGPEDVFIYREVK